MRDASTVSRRTDGTLRQAIQLMFGVLRECRLIGVQSSLRGVRTTVPDQDWEVGISPGMQVHSSRNTPFTLGAMSAVQRCQEMGPGERVLLLVPCACCRVLPCGS